MQFFEFLLPDGTPIDLKTRPDAARLTAFALKYARHWEKKYGSPPRGDHPFPNYWDTTFIICFPELISSDSPAQTSGNPA